MPLRDTSPLSTGKATQPLRGRTCIGPPSVPPRSCCGVVPHRGLAVPAALARAGTPSAGCSKNKEDLPNVAGQPASSNWLARLALVLLTSSSLARASSRCQVRELGPGMQLQPALASHLRTAAKEAEQLHCQPACHASFILQLSCGIRYKHLPTAQLRPLSLVATTPHGLGPAPEVVTLLQALAAAHGGGRHSSVLNLLPFHTGPLWTRPAPHCRAVRGQKGE